ncbi:MAG: hypothetical protein HY072_02360 [Deltaproteobacteria bacterium]|nr:hypothetical protein [Deltaproteobacteria bacterium]
MKNRLIILMTAITIFGASSAFASVAKNIVMGNGDPVGLIDRGSFYYDSNNNIFYNPSYANEYKNWATVEVSRFGIVGTTAEGGFVNAFGSWILGFYMNRSGATRGSYTNAVSHRPFDLIIASDMGTKWGLGITFGGYKTGSTTSEKDLTLRAGAQFGELEPYISVKVIGSDKTLAGETKTTGYGGGVKYKWGEWTPYLAYNKLSSPTGNINYGWGMGIGRNTKVGEAHLTYAIALWEDLGPKRWIIPVDMALEGSLTAWLKARAGFTYNLIDITKEVTTGADTTSARVGATINVSKVDFDWVIGHTGSNATSVGAVPTTGTDVTTGKSFDLASGFFTAASLTYHW